MNDLDYHKALTEAVDYDPLTGVFTRKVAAGNTKAGARVGSPTKKGYLKARIAGKQTTLHRFAWFYVYGVWPTEIDHKNQNKQDNRISNLRICDTSTNCLNQTGPRSNNSVGLQGVHIVKKTGRFRAKLRGGHLGVFSSPEEAHAAYVKAKAPLLPEV